MPKEQHTIGTGRVSVWEKRHLPTCLGRVHLRLGGRGPLMMFWPSLLMDGTMWTELALHFADRYRVALVDAPGHGESEHLTRRFTFDECALAVVQLLDALEAPKVVFVGNSWGGMIGGTFAARYPDRARASILMNATASAAGLRQKAEFFALTKIVRMLGGVRGPLVGRVVRGFLGPTSTRERPEAARAIREAVSRAHVASSVWATESVVIARPDQHALFATIRTPVLVIAGDEDPTFPVPETKRMAKAIPRSEFQIMRGVGHLAGLESPQRVAALVDDFLVRRATNSKLN